MPTNLYGPNDNFHLENSHVLPAMVRKIHLAKALMNNDWQAIKADLNKRPVEGISGENSQEEIKNILAKYGITASQVTLWGTGTPLREFLWSEDMADACVFVMERINFADTYPAGAKEVRNTHINIGTGKELSIKALSQLIKAAVGYEGNISFDSSKPDGTMRKLTNPSKLHSLGWKHTIELDEGVKLMYDYYLR